MQVRPRALAISLALFLCTACRAPQRAELPRAAHPGWGWRGVSGAERMTVRAVPASAAPSMPTTRLGKPGWGRTPPR